METHGDPRTRGSERARGHLQGRHRKGARPTWWAIGAPHPLSPDSQCWWERSLGGVVEAVSPHGLQPRAVASRSPRRGSWGRGRWAGQEMEGPATAPRGPRVEAGWPCPSSACLDPRRLPASRPPAGQQRWGRPVPGGRSAFMGGVVLRVQTAASDIRTVTHDTGNTTPVTQCRSQRAASHLRARGGPHATSRSPARDRRPHRPPCPWVPARPRATTHACLAPKGAACLHTRTR
jgi:hypothetical protein